MGIKRVELSEFSSTHRTRAHTMPEKVRIILYVDAFNYP